MKLVIKCEDKVILTHEIQDFIHGCVAFSAYEKFVGNSMESLYISPEFQEVIIRLKQEPTDGFWKGNPFGISLWIGKPDDIFGATKLENGVEVK
jgi:hypothetical protein